jgi:lincosamide and streptogramin A transport system ATP-binding/permease protein
VPAQESSYSSNSYTCFFSYSFCIYEPRESTFLGLILFLGGLHMSLINVSNLTFAYEGSYDNIFENVSFQIDTDWKLGFTGRNGKGKTTFLNLLMGKYEYSGNISATVNFQYFPYNVTDKTMLTTAVIEKICPHYQDWQLARELSLLQVNEDVLHRPFETLSNGEQTKILLAALFLSENNFLLIDEPTNHLDMLGRKIVSDYLNGKAGYILVSHDRAFLDGCVDHVLSINKANIEVQRGNFSSWFANKELRDNFELAENEKLKRDIKRLKEAAKQSGDWADKVEATKIGNIGKKAGLEKMNGLRPYIGEKSRRMQQRRKNLERRQQTAIDEKSSLLKNLDYASDLKISQLPYHKSRFLSLQDISIFYENEKHSCNDIAHEARKRKWALPAVAAGFGAEPHWNKSVCSSVTFDINHGDRIALHGKNGSGKSSIVKLICGEDIS